MQLAMFLIKMNTKRYNRISVLAMIWLYCFSGRRYGKSRIELSMSVCKLIRRRSACHCLLAIQSVVCKELEEQRHREVEGRAEKVIAL